MMILQHDMIISLENHCWLLHILFNFCVDLPKLHQVQTEHDMELSQ